MRGRRLRNTANGRGRQDASIQRAVQGISALGFVPQRPAVREVRVFPERSGRNLSRTHFATFNRTAQLI